jgi:hypothetical protein
MGLMDGSMGEEVAIITHRFSCFHSHGYPELGT